MTGKIEEVARATQATHKSDLAAEEADQMHYHSTPFRPKIVVDSGYTAT